MGYQKCLLNSQSRHPRIILKIHVFLSRFHDKITDSNYNDILIDIRGIILQSQMYDISFDLCKSDSDTVI